MHLRMINLFFSFLSTTKKIFLDSRDFLFSFLIHIFFLFLVFLGIDTRQDTFIEPVYKIELSTLSFPTKEKAIEASVEIEVEKIEKTILRQSLSKVKPVETVKPVEITVSKKVDTAEKLKTVVPEVETIEIGKIEEKNNIVNSAQNKDILNENSEKIEVPPAKTLAEEIAELQAIANQTALERDIKEEKSSTEFLEQELESMRTLANNSQKAKIQPSAEGLLEIYGNIVEEEVKKHWRYAFFSKDDNLRVIIEITIDNNGEIINPTLLVSSGKFEFDNSALRAIAKVERLPEPPINTLRKIIINFNLDELK